MQLRARVRQRQLPARQGLCQHGVCRLARHQERQLCPRGAGHVLPGLPRRQDQADGRVLGPQRLQRPRAVLLRAVRVHVGVGRPRLQPRRRGPRRRHPRQLAAGGGDHRRHRHARVAAHPLQPPLPAPAAGGDGGPRGRLHGVAPARRPGVGRERRHQRRGAGGGRGGRGGVRQRARWRAPAPAGGRGAGGGRPGHERRRPRRRGRAPARVRAQLAGRGR
mmetsp:Transcript_6534/g.15696  ORF Transcript_6534/g.15696 Transcript_6534/m.15696 type:complete len:220 (-) Transcript_6534:322-981(-)